MNAEAIAFLEDLFRDFKKDYLDRYNPSSRKKDCKCLTCRAHNQNLIPACEELFITLKTLISDGKVL